mmetsp:Transcript_24233/g.53333  ORF Transcript_24233/g.53333 Transcript_24233/m.53333 type:complete len:299 (+) Transcript_24233:885-1781(+)
MVGREPHDLSRPQLRDPQPGVSHDRLLQLVLGLGPEECPGGGVLGLGVGEQFLQVTGAEISDLILTLQHRLRHPGFEHLQPEHLILNGPRADQPIDDHRLGLTDAVGAVHCLGIHCGVPSRVAEDHPVGSRQGKADASHLSGQQHAVVLGVLLELRDLDLPAFTVHGPVNSQELELVRPQHMVRNQVQHPRRLGENQHPVPPQLQLRQQRPNSLQLARLGQRVPRRPLHPLQQRLRRPPGLVVVALHPAVLALLQDRVKAHLIRHLGLVGGRGVRGEAQQGVIAQLLQQADGPEHVGA